MKKIEPGDFLRKLVDAEKMTKKQILELIDYALFEDLIKLNCVIGSDQNGYYCPTDTVKRDLKDSVTCQKCGIFNNCAWGYGTIHFFDNKEAKKERWCNLCIRNKYGYTLRN